MNFSTKLRNYLKKNNILPSHFAKEIGKSAPMIHKYLYRGSMPDFKTAKVINITTNNFITMEDMECQ